MSTKLKATLIDLNSNLWGSCFRISDEVANNFVEANNRRILCSINGKETIACALMPSPQGYFILISKAVKKKVGLSLGDEATLEITKDESKYGMPVCEEFEAVILDDPDIFHYFEKLTPGKKRNLIHIVNKIKSSEIRINRAMAIAEHLKIEQGELEFKKLNAVIKEFNQNNRIR